MAYSNWGAFVYCNGVRREDKEDCLLFEEHNTPTSFADYWHGVMGDRDIRVGCYKFVAPRIFEQTADGVIHQIDHKKT